MEIHGRWCLQAAAMRLHPDKGGNAEQFKASHDGTAAEKMRKTDEESSHVESMVSMVRRPKTSPPLDAVRCSSFHNLSISFIYFDGHDGL